MNEVYELHLAAGPNRVSVLGQYPTRAEAEEARVERMGCGMALGRYLDKPEWLPAIAAWIRETLPERAGDLVPKTNRGLRVAFNRLRRPECALLARRFADWSPIRVVTVEPGKADPGPWCPVCGARANLLTRRGMSPALQCTVKKHFIPVYDRRKTPRGAPPAPGGGDTQPGA